MGVGWRKGVIYPDFIFSVEDGGKTAKLVAVETKGEHLKDFEETVYKQAVMRLLTENFDWDKTSPVGQLELETIGHTVVCDMVMLDHWEKQISRHLH